MAETHPIPTHEKFKNLTGLNFGRWTVVSYAGRTGKSLLHSWKCVCKCGKIKIKTAGSLIDSKSCGCLRTEKTIARSTTHGNSGLPEYEIWIKLKSRCLNPNNKDWIYYGGRGITVCEEWQEFIPFKDWAIANGYADHLQIDRIDNDSGYRPDNCRFVTRSENQRNKRNSKK